MPGFFFFFLFFLSHAGCFIFIFFSYALFPLLLVLDASIDCRSKQNSSSKGNFDTYSSPPLPYPVSDRVAEGVLQCLEEVLKKCHLGSVDQVFAFTIQGSFVAVLRTDFVLTCINRIT